VSFKPWCGCARTMSRPRSRPPTPPLGLAPETLTELVRAQVRLLRTLLATIADLDRALGAGLLGHAKAKLLAPMPGIGEVNLAQLVAEVGPILERVDNAEQAIAECGAAPVTRASGKTRTVGFPWAARLYADARRRGKHHPHAIRILARAWLRVMWACWHTDTAYDPAKHRSEQRLAA
jgi:transposase